jgi:prepilin-type N-terminal cleavage/methylation domain-containing protein
MTNTSRSRRGFTLIELIVGMLIFAIVGALFTQLLSTQGRYFDKQGMANAARNVSRGSLNRIVSDFRMIEATGGVVAATPTSLTIRVPYAIGVVCANVGVNNTVLSLLPVDSVMYSLPGFHGYAWRSSLTGVYTYVENPATLLPGSTSDIALCAGQQITTLTGGRIVSVAPIVPATAGLGTPVFIYRLARYEFKASTAVPGKLGLFRTILSPGGGTVTSEELVAPFANTAKYRFFVVGNNTTAQDNPPAILSLLRGVELHLSGTSETIAAGKTEAENAPFVTAVFFKNRTN